MKKVKKIILTIFLLIFVSQGTGLNSLALAQEISSYNRNVIRETQRLDPLLIVSNTCPRDFNEKMAKAISDALGVNVQSLIDDDEWDRLIRESIQDSEEATFKALLEKVKDYISEKTRKRIVKSFEDIPVTEYAKKVVRKEFARYLNNSLKTDWDPKVEAFIVDNATAILTEALAQSGASFLFKPEFYQDIHDTLKQFFSTKIEDLPLISELLTTKLVDYIPGGDLLTNINDFIDNQIETFKAKVTNEAYTAIAQPISSAIFKAVAGILPPSFEWLGGFLGALESAVNDILKQAIGEYVDKYVTDIFRDNFWTVYNFKNELSKWVEATIKDVLPPETQRDVEKTLLEILPEDAQRFFIDVMAIAQAIANYLTPPAEEVKSAAGEKVVSILFPGLEELLNKTLYDWLVEREPFKSFFEAKPKDKLPPALTNSLYSIFPEEAKTPIIDQLLPEYAEILKNKRLIDLIKEEYRDILTKKIKDLSPEEWNKVKNLTLMEMMSAAGAVLAVGLVSMMYPEFRNFYNKTVLETLPKECRETLFQLLGIDNPETSQNEARTKELADYLSEDVRIFIDLIHQYIPDPKEREWINPVLEILSKTPKRLIAEEFLRPDLAEKFDTPLPELLDENATSTKILKLTWLEIVAGAGFYLTKSLLERLADTDPALYKALNTKLKDLITGEDLTKKENQNKTLIDLLAEKVGDPSVADKIQQNKIIDLFPDLKKSPVDLVAEKNPIAHQVFSKSFYDLFPEEIKEVLEIKPGDLIKDKYPFNITILSLFPESWQGLIKDALEITDQDIENYIHSAIENAKDDIAQVLYSNLKWAEESFVKNTAYIFNEKLAKKIGKDVLTDENMKKISSNIADALEPIIEKAIKEPIEKGYLFDSLNEINLSE